MCGLLFYLYKTDYERIEHIVKHEIFHRVLLHVQVHPDCLLMTVIVYNRHLNHFEG